MTTKLSSIGCNTHRQDDADHIMSVGHPVNPLQAGIFKVFADLVLPSPHEHIGRDGVAPEQAKHGEKVAPAFRIQWCSSNSCVWMSPAMTVGLPVARWASIPWRTFMVKRLAPELAK